MMTDKVYILIILLANIVILTGLGFFMLKMLNIAHQKTLRQKQADFQQRLAHEEALKNAIIHTQDEERKAIAAELHDQISNKLNLILLLIRNLPQENQNPALEHIKGEIKKLILKNRDISHYLFPVEIENIGLLLTLQDLSIKHQHLNFAIDLYFRKEIHLQNKTVELQLYRVIQEFISNSIKHGQATKVIVQFTPLKHALGIYLQDNGKGFDLAKVKKGLGLNNIQTRLQSINADFKYKSNPQGTRLIIMIRGDR